MSDYRDKPWMRPCVYNDDRFAEPTKEEMPQPFPHYREHEDTDGRDDSEVEEILRRPDRGREEREYECNDTTPVDYRRGPHDEEFGVDENEFDAPDDTPVPYENGPHDQEFGDDDDFEPLDDEPEFPED